jgi:hypothetical protein
MKFKTFLSVGVILLFSSVLVLAALDLKFTTAIKEQASLSKIKSFSVSFKTFGGPVDNLKITGGVDGGAIYHRTYAHIDADTQKTETFTWTPSAGTHIIWFELDPKHTCGDSNYANNRIEKTITVKDGPIPVVSHANLALQKYINVTSPADGVDWYNEKGYTITWNTNINNVGKSFFIELYSTDEKTKIKLIKQGETSTSFYWPVMGIYPGDYRIRVSSFQGRDDGFVEGFSEIFHIKPPVIH